MSGVVVTEEKIAEAKELYSTHFGNDSIFNEEGNVAHLHHFTFGPTVVQHHCGLPFF